MPFGAIAAIAAPIIGGMISGDASQSAAQTQSDAARYAADLQNQRYQQTRQDLMPYMQMGPTALSNLEALMGFGPIGGMGGGMMGGAMGGAAGLQPSPGVPQAAAAPAATQGMFAGPGGQIYQPLAAGSREMIQAMKAGKPYAAATPGGGAQLVSPGAPNAFGTVGAPSRLNLQAVSPGAPAVDTAAAAQGGGATAGGMGLGGFSRDAMMNALTANPAYQFNLQQGQQAINRGAAARGMYYAPTTLQDLGSYAQGLASQEYGNIWNRLFSMAGMGQNAATQTGQFGAAAAGAQGGLLTDAARAQAGGIMGQAQAYGGMLGGVTGALQNPQTQQWLQSLYGTPTYPSMGGYGAADIGMFSP